MKNIEILLSKDVILNFLWVKPTTFIMGTPAQYARESQKQFRVNITKGYWLAETPLTKGQFYALMNTADSIKKDDNIPYGGLNWHDCINICEVLNKKFTHLLPKGYLFSLPTEAQWENACKAGTETLYYNGNDVEKLDDIGWYKENSNSQIKEVKLKQPNDWGFYDMLGLVFEWCLDSFTPYIENSVVDDWLCIDEKTFDNNLKIVRSFSYKTDLHDKSTYCSDRIYMVKGNKMSSSFSFRPAILYEDLIKDNHLK